MKTEDKLKEIRDRFDVTLSNTSTIKGRLLSTTNKRFQKYIMEDMLDIQFDRLMMLFPKYMFHTSYITKVECKLENQFHIKTRNSLYVVEILDVEYLSWFKEGILFEMSEEEMNMIEKYLRGEVE